jgi:cytochrome b561
LPFAARSAALALMTDFYLALALALAITLNARPAPVRAIGHAVAATAMGFLAWSIVLANRDGTFASVAASDRTPLLLNIQAGLIGLGALLLVIAIPRLFRRDAGTVPPRSSSDAHGHITRGLHWASAVLIIAAFTMGQFVGILGEDRPERAEFLATHMAIGGAVFLLTFARMFERLVRPAPATRAEVMIAHFLVYSVLIAICLTGLAMADAPIRLLGLNLPNLPKTPMAAPLHVRALPVVFGLLLALHLLGAVKAIRRMLR